MKINADSTALVASAVLGGSLNAASIYALMTAHSTAEEILRLSHAGCQQELLQPLGFGDR